MLLLHSLNTTFFFIGFSTKFSMMVAPGVRRLFNRAGAHVHCPRVPPQGRRIKWLQEGSDAFFIVYACLPGLEDS